MKLSEIKVHLVEQFFKDEGDGVAHDQVEVILEGLSARLSSNFDGMLNRSNQSADPSKAFKRFTEGKQSMLTICNEDHIIFAAARVGKKVEVIDLTKQPLTEKTSDLAAVKAALRQSKNVDEDVYFNISIK